MACSVKAPFAQVACVATTQRKKAVVRCRPCVAEVDGSHGLLRKRVGEKAVGGLLGKWRSDMHARVVVAKLKPGTIPEFTRIYRGSALPAASQEPGYSGAILLVNPEADKATAITIWDSVESMTSGQDNGYVLELFQKFAGMFAEPPVSEHLDVVVGLDA